ncbi:hypothetical protein BIV25_02925 [Streptomyces sp. MUSC 14]|uniref:hypothetical protein n=1 Tax=Streptomyces sp. MUSC 14 TaxID=1354889 RepID=UPI0008F5903A|nr:hypothetical protein [Streptomyces sp. MUSC 14]OIK02553.1 hypothetical protein BIV25_02925 [Streptomyces sp. MUSC 14]
MDVMPGGISLALYALTVVCAVALVTLWVLANRGRRNAGFASKGQLKRQMSAKAVLRATEIRPSLTRADDQPAPASAVSLAKDRSAGR